MELSGARIYDEGVEIKKDAPIGIYNRGPSLNAVLEILQRKVRKECLKIKKESVSKFRTNNKTFKHLPLEMAG